MSGLVRGEQDTPSLLHGTEERPPCRSQIAEHELVSGIPGLGEVPHCHPKGTGKPKGRTSAYPRGTCRGSPHDGQQLLRVGWTRWLLAHSYPEKGILTSISQAGLKTRRKQSALG